MRESRAVVGLCVFLGCAAAFGDCFVEEEPSGRIVLRNETLRVVLDPAAGGKGVSLKDLRSGAELTGWPNYGFLEDRLWSAGERESLSQQAYSAVITESGPDSATVRMSARSKSPGFEGLALEKEVSVRRGEHAVRVRTLFRNEGEGELPLGLWVMNGFGEAGLSSRIYIPTTAGVKVARHLPGDPEKPEAAWKGEGDGVLGADRFVYSHARGWMGILSPGGRGVVCLAEPEKVSCFYNFFTGRGVNPTLEWIYNKFALAPGADWRTEYVLLPVADMPRLDGAGKGVAGSVEIDGEVAAGKSSEARVSLFSHSETRVGLVFTIADNRGREKVERRELELEAAGMTEAVFEFAPAESGRYLLRFEVVGPDGEPVMDMERPLGVGAPAGSYALERDFEPEGELMERFRSHDVSENLLLTAPRGQRGYATHRIVSDYATPHVPWAKPYAGGRTRVLITEHAGSMREAVELDQRADLEYECIYHHPAAGGKHPLYEDVKVMSAFERARWDELLERDFDLFLIGAVAWPYYPEDIQNEILRRVERGDSGLLIVQPTGSWRYKEDFLYKLGMESEDVSGEFTRDLPLELMPNLKKRKLVLRGRHGEGFIYQVSYASGLRPFYGAALVPTRFDGLSRQTPAERDGMPLDEWRYSFLTRVVLSAAGRAPEGGLSLDSAARNLTSEEAETARFGLRLGALASKARKLEYELIDRYGEKLRSESLDLGAGGGEPELPAFGPLKEGVHVLAVRLLDAEGRVLDWSIRDFAVKAPMRLEKAALERDFYRDGDIVAGKVEIERGEDAPNASALDVEIHEDGGRFIGRESFSMAGLAGGGEVEFAIRLERPLWRSATVRLKLKDGERVVDEARVPIFCEPIDKEDMSFITYYPLSVEQQKSIGINAIYGSDLAERNNLRRFIWGSNPNIHVNFQSHSNSTGPERNPCFTDPEYRETVREQLTKARENYGEREILGYVFADEWKYGGRNTQRPNLCATPSCLRSFRGFLRDKYGEITALNEAWGSSYGSFEDAEPLLPAATDRKLDEYRAGRKVKLADWLDHKLYLERTVSDFLGFCQRQLGDSIPLGLSGTQRTDQGFFVGLDFWQLYGRGAIRAGNLYGGTQLELARSFSKPGHFITKWDGYDVDDTQEKHARMAPWQALVMGRKGVSYYFTRYSPPEFPDYTLRKQAYWIRDAIAPLRSGVARMVRQAEPDGAKVAILYSAASLHATRLFHLIRPSAPLSGPNLDSMVALTKAVGMNFDFVSYEEVAAGKLERYKLLILPYIHYLTEAEAAAIGKFVEGGGVAVADVSAPELSEMLGGASLAPLFGVEAEGLPDFEMIGVSAGGSEAMFARGFKDLRLSGAAALMSFADGTPALVVAERGEGKAIYLNLSLHDYKQVSLGGVGGEVETAARAGEAKRLAAEALMNAVLSQCGLSPKVTIAELKTGANYGAEIFGYSNGDVEHYVILRAMDGGRIKASDSREVEIDFGREAHIYDTLSGAYLGGSRTLRTTLTDGLPALFTLQKAPSGELTATTRGAARAGEAAEIELRIEGPERGVFEVVAKDPAGVERYRRIVSYEGGRAATEIPFAFNDPSGRWKVEARDVGSGVGAEAEIEVRAAR